MSIAKDVRKLIYGYLTLEEKMKIKGIKDEVLNEMMIEEMEKRMKERV